MNILAVNVRDTSYRLVRTLLSRRGHHFVRASSILEAMAIVLIGPIEVVLLDFRAEGAESRRLVQFISSNWNTFHIPVIVVSESGGDDDNRCWAKICGCWRYLDRPFDPSQVLDAVLELEQGRPETSFPLS